MEPSERTITFSVDGPIARADLDALSARLCGLFERSTPTLALCDVRSVSADAVTVEALARLHLLARRHGCRVELLHASDELRDLARFMGLAGVLSS